ncbi:type II toxin-antitoxin system VapC family toxin [Sphingopyxis sp. XHP0097]|uniref:Type II toxin-antitoxin system VapC family toxin n=2 Tax=Sphingomonadaceae TaxID=41297 RepID=A0ABS7M9D1_9SPHN|nr:type II toxin-antitoxin system VapC family toxin [Sphingopyxis jiangsuensis]
MLGDDDVQSPIAHRILQGEIFVPLTVLLETGWVLKSSARLDRTQIAEMLATFVQLPNVQVDDLDGVLAALTAYAKGGDFADHIHLVASKGVEAFVTFDRGVMANEDIGVPVEIVG